MTLVPFKYAAHIRNNATGEVRVRQEEWTHEGWDGPASGVHFFWTDGNFGCDCNRAIWWHDDGNIDRTCGSGKFSVRLIAEDGTIILDELANA